MAYPIALNNLYKSEKAEGVTTAKSYPEWYKEYQTRTPILDELLATFEPETLEVEPLLLTHQQLEAEIAALEQDLHEDTSEELELAIASTPLSKDQVDAIVATLAIQPVEPEVVTPTSKASHARQIYQEEEQAALVANITLVRNKVIKRFMAELPLSAPGSATYFQNIKKSKGLVNHKS